MPNNVQILESYRISTSYQEIVEILNRSHAVASSIMWQSLPNHRTMFRFKEFHLQLSLKKIVITYDGGKEFVNPDLPVYVKLPFREMVFKGQVTEIHNNIVTLSVPEEIHMREFRESLRTNFKEGERFAHIRPTTSLIGPDRLSTLKVTLKDIAQIGMGFYISENNSHLFRAGNLIELMGLEDINFMTPLLAKVIYVRKESLKFGQKKSMYVVGIQMINLIPEQYLQQLTKRKANKKSIARNLIESELFSNEFRDLITKGAAKEIEKLKQRPALLKYLNKLELIRGQDDYIEEHIKVLTIVCTFIARSMNWVSDASMEKFVYAAYLHDAPFFSYPRLARIRNMDEFDLMKDQLTDEEQRVFLTAPQVSAQIALSDPGAPPDVSSMLSLQKELPSGLGFPNKWSFSKISPMASLFIVAHDLTDEVMTNPDWDIGLWLGRAKKTYRGGHFNKLMEALETVKITLKRSL